MRLWTYWQRCAQLVWSLGMDEYKKLFSNIGSKNEYIKIAVLLIFVTFLLSSILGKMTTIIIGVIALLFACLGIVYKLKRITSDHTNEDKEH
jgi:Na+/H+ antiporter NhaD/arsenite permease-like protein